MVCGANVEYAITVPAADVEVVSMMNTRFTVPQSDPADAVNVNVVLFVFDPPLVEFVQFADEFATLIRAYVEPAHSPVSVFNNVSFALAAVDSHNASTNVDGAIPTVMFPVDVLVEFFPNRLSSRIVSAAFVKLPISCLLC